MPYELRPACSGARERPQSHRQDGTLSRAQEDENRPKPRVNVVGEGGLDGGVEGFISPVLLGQALDVLEGMSLEFLDEKLASHAPGLYMTDQRLIGVLVGIVYVVEVYSTASGSSLFKTTRFSSASC